jgi:hypothetical protein
MPAFRQVPRKPWPFVSQFFAISRSAATRNLPASPRKGDTARDPDVFNHKGCFRKFFRFKRPSPPIHDSHIQFTVNRPAGVRGIAALFVAVAAYLLTVALIMLVAPGTLSMATGAPLLFGLELAGPYMFLLVAAAAAFTAWGLWCLHNWARRVAALAALIGIVMLVPKVSGDVSGGRYGILALGGLQIMIRVLIAWYLYQAPVIQAFEPH